MLWSSLLMSVALNDLMYKMFEDLRHAIIYPLVSWNHKHNFQISSDPSVGATLFK